MEGLNVAKHEEAMELTLIKLKNKVQNFVTKEKRLYQDYKAKLEYKDCEQRILECRFKQAIIKLESLKHKIYQHSKMKSLYYDTKKQCDKLQKDLTDCMKVRYLYEDHADLIKREMNTKLKDKESEINKYKREIQRLASMCRQNEKTMADFRETLKCKTEDMKKKLNGKTMMYDQEKQKTTNLQEKLIETQNSLRDKKKEIQTMNMELEKYRLAKYEEKMTEKQRENVMLREELAILKIELEKARLKGML